MGNILDRGLTDVGDIYASDIQWIETPASLFFDEQWLQRESAQLSAFDLARDLKGEEVIDAEGPLPFGYPIKTDKIRYLMEIFAKSSVADEPVGGRGLQDSVLSLKLSAPQTDMSNKLHKLTYARTRLFLRMHLVG
jgi:hypothetical protein